MIVGSILSKEADLDVVTKKDDVRSMGHVESFCATEVTAELWSVEYELVKQRDGDAIKQGGLYLDYKVVQILAIAFEMDVVRAGRTIRVSRGECRLAVSVLV